jgi:hypothetical protein
MKTNIVLLVIFVVLTSLTWYLTEGKKAELIAPEWTAWQESLQQTRTLRLPQTHLKQTSKAWRGEDGQFLRQEYVQELLTQLSSLKPQQFIQTSLKAADEAAFLGISKILSTDSMQIQLGELCPSRDCFYVYFPSAQKLWSVDLNQLASKAMADQDQHLNEAKYHRLMDLVTLSSEQWWDRRVTSAFEFKTLRFFQKENLKIDFQALPASLKSLFYAEWMSLKWLNRKNVFDPDFTKIFRPQDVNWNLIFQDEKASPDSAKISLFKRKDLDLYALAHEKQNTTKNPSWIYTLDQESSDRLKTFPEKLVREKKYFSLYDSSVDIEISIDSQKALHKHYTEEQKKSLQNLFTSSQWWSNVTFWEDSRCQENRLKSLTRLTLQGHIWHLEKSLQILRLWNCAASVALEWQIPLESPLNFVNL